MPDSVPAILIVAIVVVPGFLAFYIARELSRAATKTVSDWELLLSSIAFTSIILATGAAVASALVAVWPHLALFGGTTGHELATQGYLATLKAHPARVVGVASLEYLGECMVIALVGGAWDPVGNWLEDRRRSKGFTELDPWTAGLVGLRQSYGKSHTFVRVELTSGTCYYGYLSKMSNGAREDGSRDLVLQNFTVAPNRDATAVSINPEEAHMTAVILSTNVVVAVEAIFVEGYGLDNAVETDRSPRSDPARRPTIFRR